MDKELSVFLLNEEYDKEWLYPGPNNCKVKTSE